MNSSVIESISGSIVTLSDSGLADGLGTPLFNWLASLINFVIKFFPVFVLVTFFWLLYGFFSGSFNKKKDKNNKSLENK